MAYISNVVNVISTMFKKILHLIGGLVVFHSILYWKLYYNVLESEIMEAYNKTDNEITDSKIITKEQSLCAI